MSLEMKEPDREIAPEVFRACLPARGAKARDDGPFLPSAAFLRGPRRHPARAAGAVRKVERRPETARPARPRGRVRGRLRHAGGSERHGAPGADVRRYRHPGACLRRRRERGRSGQAPGRSRPSRRTHAFACRATGGFGTKIHLKTDQDGLPIAFDPTGGEAADSRHFETPLNPGPDVRPRAAVAPSRRMPCIRPSGGGQGP